MMKNYHHKKENTGDDEKKIIFSLFNFAHLSKFCNQKKILFKFRMRRRKSLPLEH